MAAKTGRNKPVRAPRGPRANACGACHEVMNRMVHLGGITRQGGMRVECACGRLGDVRGTALEAIKAWNVDNHIPDKVRPPAPPPGSTAKGKTAPPPPAPALDLMAGAEFLPEWAQQAGQMQPGLQCQWEVARCYPNQRRMGWRRTRQ